VSTASVPAVTVDVLPTAAAFTAGSALPRARAYAGAHRSRATGEGIDFAGVRPYASGDQLRRLNWRATARTGELTVTSTHTDRAADLVVVLDVLYDVGPWGRSSVDTAVRAAFGIVQHYIRLGDSVGLLEYGGYQRVLAPGTGRTQLARTRDWLLDTRSIVTAAVRAVRWPAVFGSRAPLVVALTPLIDETSWALLARLRGQGAAVVAIDTLTTDSLPRTNSLRDEVAGRLWRLEREMTIARLADLGVPVEPWSGNGGLDVQLDRLTRVATAPRLALR
jgi:uncharacterized protein (DUF58 family)